MLTLKIANLSDRLAVELEFWYDFPLHQNKYYKAIICWYGD
ncbi:hypothetical protein BTN49_2187 [Candidatus Enterovibrio escicola]|uniref:Uncharacterized protein n=1 Tax=Candidatus Enterovibrio escicola TaxID=1927127 RepID=A0A2A5T236_9GAMM|nr:hypothetical protein BTN49_2187 [Candidatus Enterovibrio escacola]